MMVFLLHDAMRKRGLCCRRVRPSVRPSVTIVLLKIYRQTYFSAR